MKRLAVIFGVAGVSLSAVFVRWSTAPSLVLTFYRMAFSVLLLTPVAVARRSEFQLLRRRELLLCLLSGAFLGFHFTCYFEALRWTSIAPAVVLVDTEVLFVALASALIFQKKLSGRAWLAVLAAFGGSVLVALSDASAGFNTLWGDVLALFGALCMAVYTLIGVTCRRRLSTTVYTCLVYAAAAGTVLLIIVGCRQSLTGWGPVNLLAALGMAVFCTLLGHSVLSWGLRFLPPAFISTVKLLEPVFAAAWGLLLFGERPGILMALGGLAILMGIALYSREEA